MVEIPLTRNGERVGEVTFEWESEDDLEARDLAVACSDADVADFLQRGIFENSEGVSILGGHFPESLEFFPEGVTQVLDIAVQRFDGFGFEAPEWESPKLEEGVVL